MTILTRISYVVKNNITGADFPKQIVGLILSEDVDFITIRSRDNLIFKIAKRTITETAEVKNRDY